MIKITNLSYTYKSNKRLVLDNINLNIKPGKITVIVGKNGSGKSTLGKLIAGILKVKTGEISLDGDVGIVFQNPDNQIIFNSIYDELSFSLKNLSMEDKDIRIKEALGQVSMLDYIETDLYELSGGEKQRIVIAEILARRPKYIIFDEGTTMIDSSGKEDIYKIVNKLKEQGIGIIWITNMKDEILLGDDIYILDDRKIKEHINKRDLINKTDILKKYDIELPSILQIIDNLKERGITLSIDDITTDNLVSALYEKLN